METPFATHTIAARVARAQNVFRIVAEHLGRGTLAVACAASPHAAQGGRAVDALCALLRAEESDGASVARVAAGRRGCAHGPAGGGDGRRQWGWVGAARVCRYIGMILFGCVLRGD